MIWVLFWWPSAIPKGICTYKGKWHELLYFCWDKKNIIQWFCVYLYLVCDVTSRAVTNLYDRQLSTGSGHSWGRCGSGWTWQDGKWEASTFGGLVFSVELLISKIFVGQRHSGGREIVPCTNILSDTGNVMNLRIDMKSTQVAVLFALNSGFTTLIFGWPLQSTSLQHILPVTPPMASN